MTIDFDFYRYLAFVFFSLCENLFQHSLRKKNKRVDANNLNFCFEFNHIYVTTFSAAQRLALPAGGMAKTRRRNGKSRKPRKAQKTPCVPTCPLHAVLACGYFETVQLFQENLSQLD